MALDKAALLELTVAMSSTDGSHGLETVFDTPWRTSSTRPLRRSAA